MGLALEPFEYYDNSGGLDLKSSPTKTDEDDATDSLNVDYAIDGAVFTRNGSTILNQSGGVPQPIDQLQNLGSYDYKKSDGTAFQVFQNGSKIYYDLVTPVADVTGLDATTYPDFDFMVTPDDEYLIWGNGVDVNLKFNGTSWTNLSLPTPANPVVIDNGVGVLPAGEYDYYIQFVRTVGGVIQQRSDLNSTPQSVTILINHENQITRPAIPDAQVNGWIIFRKSPTSLGKYLELVDGSGVPVIVASGTAAYVDNIAADGKREPEFDDQPAPNTNIFESAFGRMFYGSGASVFYSKPNLPWAVPTDNEIILDGTVNCIFPAYGTVCFSTSNGTLWVLNGDPDTNDARQISHTIGVLNNRCFGGEGNVYIFATNRKFYLIRPTDFSQQEIRINDPISIRIEPLVNQIPASATEKVFARFYTRSNQAKFMVSVPIASTNNNKVIVYNETQSQQKQKNVWQLWDNWNVSAMQQFVINGDIRLIGGDYNGYLWYLDNAAEHGDGVEENGTVVSATVNTLTDDTKTWTVNAYRGMRVAVIDSQFNRQSVTVVSNTATALTVTPNFNPTPDNTYGYSIGSYDNYHFTNWKSVTGSYDTIKQLWFFISNLNASGNYTIQLIIQYDFDSTVTNSTILNIDLTAGNALWGGVIWGAFTWGAFAVFQDRIRQFGRFRAVRFGFRSQIAGHPFQLNGFSLSVQDKGLLWSSAP